MTSKSLILKMTENLSVEEQKDLKKLLIAFKAQRLSMLVDQVWEGKGWTQETMDQFLKTRWRRSQQSKSTESRSVTKIK